MKKIPVIASFLIGALIFSPSLLFAVGSGSFENASFSAKEFGLGTAVTAVADEPAAISYNPAGLNDLPGVQFQGNANFINMWTTIDSKLGGSTQSSATTVMVPTSYLTINPGKNYGLNDRIAFGIGTDSPFGLMNKYDSNHTATSFTGYRNWLKMYTIKPVVSLRLADWLSVAAGPVWYRMFDFGQIAHYPNAGLAAFGLVGPTTPNGQIRADLAGNAWGWNMGVLVKPAPKHKIGFYFRSPVLIHAKGLLKGENIADQLGGTGVGGNFETGVHTKLHLPYNMSWGYQYKFNEKTSVSTDFGFTHWSVFNNLNVPVDPISGTSLGGLSAFHDILLNSLLNTPGPGGAADKDYHNSFTWAWGLEHKATDKLTLRLGNYYYTTPIPGHHFTPVVPDSNRMAWTAGIGYALTDNFQLDASYAGVVFFRRKVDNDIGNALGVSMDGTYSSYLQIWSLSMSYKFDGLKSAPKAEDWEGSTVSVK